MAKDIAARAGLLNDREQSQAMVIGAIGRGGYATPQVVEFFDFLRRVGNEAVHEGKEEFALNAVNIARQLARGDPQDHRQRRSGGRADPVISQQRPARKSPSALTC